MRNRDRFNAAIDEEKERQLSAKIKATRRIIKQLYTDLHHSCAIIEPCEYMLVWGSLERCLIAIESGITLVSQGFIGSANAMLRQILEFLMWAKLGLEADEETLIKINSKFYDDSLGKSNPVTSILKNTTVHDLDEETPGAELSKECQVTYHNYSFLTHATSIAQQTPYHDERFYERCDHCLTELCVLLDTFLLVFLQYCEKVKVVFLEKDKQTKFDPLVKPITDEEKKMGYLFAATMHIQEIQPRIARFHTKLSDVYDELATNLQLTFLARWSINGEKIK